MGTGYYHVLTLSFVSYKKNKEGVMVSCKISLEDNIEMTGECQHRNHKLCHGRDNILMGIAFVRSKMQGQDEQL